MRQIVTYVLWFSLVGMAAIAGSIPEEINYQGVLRDAGGIPLDGGHDMVFRFWSAPTAGEEILLDSHTAATAGAVEVSNGLFSVALGGGDVGDGAGPGTYATLGEVFRDYGSVYVGIQVNGDPEMVPRIPVMASPYAFNADRLDGRDASEFLTTDGGTLTGALDLAADGLTAGTDQLALANGRVGVGTGTPQNPLHVAGSGGAISSLADGVHMGIDASNNTHIELVKAGGSPYIDFNTSNSSDSEARIRLVTGNHLAVEAPNFTVNGNLGVGTDAPGARLDVIGTVRTSGQLASTLSTGTSPLSVASTTKVDNLNVDLLDGYDASEFLTFDGGSITGTLNLAADGLVAGTDQLVLSSGRVGVGTASPGNKLHVTGGGLTVDGANTGSAIDLAAGHAPTNGLGGAVDVTAGTGYNMRGGHMTLQAGKTSSWSGAGASADAWLRGGFMEAAASYAEVHVEGGKAAVGGTNESSGGRLVLSGGSGVGTNRSGGDILLQPGAATGSGTPGRVGVGTGTPQNPLHVAGSGGAISSLADGVHMGIDASNNTHIELVKAGGSPYIDFNTSNSSDSEARIRLVTGNHLAVEAPNFTVNGNLGVGTDAPGARLDVIGTVRTSGQLASTLSTGTSPLSVASTTKVDNLNVDLLDGYDASEFLTFDGGSITGTLNLAADGLVAGTDQLVLSSGRVGVGTASPGNKLHVTGGGLTVDGANTGSAIDLAAGHAPTNGLGGAVDVTAGTGYNMRGGHMTLQAGKTSSWSGAGASADAWLRGGFMEAAASYAEVHVEGGKAAVGGTNESSGGRLVLSGGSGVGTNRSGGDILLQPGAATGSGTPGRVGVGTGTPQNPLHVAGSGGAISSLADGVHMGIDASNNTHIELVKAGGSPYIDFNTSNSSDSEARIRLVTGNHLAVEAPNFTVNGNLGVGTDAPGARLDVIGTVRTSGQLASTLSTGTSPLSVTSTTKVDNLNVDLLDGYDATDFATTSDLHDRYSDTEALDAMGTKADDNPLHHDRPADLDIAEASPQRKRIALRRWYDVNTSTSFPVGLVPGATLFDGAHVWVANAGSGTVSKLRASDGEVVGTFTVDTEPVALAYDGAHVWVGDRTDATLTKLRAHDGTELDAIPLSDRADDVEFDGASLWVAHGASPGMVSKIRPSDGAVLGTYASGGDCPVALEFDGSHLWVANSCGAGTVAKMQPSDGSIVGSYTVFDCVDLAYDGESLWVASSSAGEVVRLRASDGTNLGSSTVGSLPAGLTFDGTHVWVANSGDDTVTRLRAADGTPAGTFGTGTAPAAIVFDGTGVWVTNRNDGSISKM